MAFDFRKEYRDFYLPKNTPELVTVPRANCAAVRGLETPTWSTAPIMPPSMYCTRWNS